MNSVPKLLSLKLESRPFFWGFLSYLTFFFSLSLSLSSSIFPIYFPYLLISLMGIVFFFRSWGLYLALTILIPFFYTAFCQKAVWELSILYSLALGYFIALLSFEEDADHLVVSKEETTFNAEEKSFEKEREDFQKTIDQLKDEAQRRYLEMSNLKDALVAHEGRFGTLEKEYKKELLEKEYLLNSIEELKEKRFLEASSLQEEFSLSKNQYICELEKANQQISSLQNEINAQVEKKSFLEEELLLMKTRWEEEKAKILEIGTEKQKELEQELKLLQKKLEEEALKVQSLEKDMVSQIPFSREKNKELADVSGKYHQLREQFEEKSKVLSQTRKELFHVQTKLMAFERDHQLNIEVPMEEKELISALELEMEHHRQLLDEIHHLEQLTQQLLT